MKKAFPVSHSLGGSGRRPDANSSSKLISLEQIRPRALDDF